MGFSPFLKVGNTASGFSQNLGIKRVNIEMNIARGKEAVNYLI
ncbi:hypothetical protein ADICYQ_1810 [Cyclobacterium qasimii M12-11B]|uniref:Uncharacterized protein n=1 Tax=Cyclobacterium qasimii M12-11B TaxID=641524 RepID=S7VI13_9BACT|nr:hypothetical protein ADICYQ_1810 [Cyclobacterium qasimii M12-11B]